MRFPWTIVSRATLERTTSEIERLRREHATALDWLHQEHRVQLERLSTRVAELHAQELRLAREDERQRVAGELGELKREHRRWLEHAAARGDFTASAILGGVK